jgi:hypothetical protein
VVEILAGAGMPPIGVGPEDVTVPMQVGDGYSLMWPLFWLIVFTYVSWRLWKWYRGQRGSVVVAPLTEDDLLQPIDDFLPSELLKHQKWASKTVRKTGRSPRA